MDIKEVCYKCGRIATSREHVPPLCLFPELKDTGRLNFRKNLLTVPSCDEHNSKKSADDEFLMVAIAGVVSNNFLGYLHTQTKVSRALRRKSAGFLEKVVVRNAKSLVIEAPSGRRYPVLLGDPDIKRLYRCFEQIAVALWYHRFGVVFRGELQLIMGFIKHDQADDNTLINFVRSRFEVEPLAEPERGDNPEVFKYLFCAPDDYGLIALKMTFYMGTDVYVSFKLDGARQPYDLPMYLIQQGIPTTITLNGEEFSFNKS